MEQGKTRGWSGVLAGLLVLLLAGCSGGRHSVTLPAQEEEVEVTARNFSFTPDEIRAKAGTTLTLQVKSASATEHNITVKNPAGKTLISQDVPVHETVTVVVPLEEPGEYPFYCDQTMHGTLGMKGRLVAE
ncbi:MAG: cupredoxin domain-containing protein [Desulfuromonadales bacterium]|nr:cupredoxin domain-containing protein [Desulfuromonadales bacterium]